MNRGDPISPNLLRLLRHQLPRVITQACRNPESPAHGCFDRNWWHYKIRDFPSAVLQQGGYMLQQARLSGVAAQLDIPDTRSLERASIRFWADRASRYGAFEEYYPWERGYPPLAFSTLAIAKMLAVENDLLPSLLPQLAKAAQQLCARFESQAANQQVAGLAAMAWLRRLDPALISQRAWNAKRDATLALQRDDGWFEEYGGPDLGYLSVTIDCLWDIVDANNDVPSLEAIERSVQWIHPFVTVTHGNIGMHNSRNTDYLVPYGFARTAVASLPSSRMALEIFGAITANLDSPNHPFLAIDDRYLAHYIGHSVIRAYRCAEAAQLEIQELASPCDRTFATTGHRIVPLDREHTLLISAHKGGNASVHDELGRTVWSDFGWVIESSRGKFGMNWQDSGWTFAHEPNLTRIAGAFIPQRHTLGTPLRHLLLRIASGVLGPSLIGILKRLLIFRRPPSRWAITRSIRWNAGGVVLEDRIVGPGAPASARAASRSSNRHVSSADSYHAEDLCRALDRSAVTLPHNSAIVSEFQFVSYKRVRP